VDDRFKKSSFLVDADLANGQRRFMSTLYLSVVELEPRYVHLLDHCHEQPVIAKEDLDVLLQLRQLGLARFQHENELAIALQQIEQWRSHKCLSVILCLTFACNFRCVYCYEKSSVVSAASKQVMSPETALSALAWMNEVIRARDIESARITFFGGEPLICYDVIRKVLERSANIFDGTRLELNMSTNGSLLTPDKIATLYSLGLRRLQLTLDGPPEIHDRRRPMASGRGTFQRVLDSLIECLDHGMDIDLLTVCDDENIDSLSSLQDVLCRVVAREKRPNIHWSFTLVEPIEHCAGRCAQLLFGKERRLAAAVHDARESAYDAGFDVVFPYSSNICARQLDYAFGIGPKGDIYPCFGVFGSAQYSIGTITDSFEAVEQKSREWARQDCFDEACVSCEVFPICRGSRCQHMAAQLNRGKFAQKYCERQFLIEDIRRCLSSRLAGNADAV